MATGPVTLKTERLILRSPDVGLASAVATHHARNRDHHARWSPPRPRNFETVGYWEDKIPQQIADFNAQRSARFTVALAFEPSVIIGLCNLNDVVLGPFRACTLGYGIDEDAVGKGIASEAVKAVVRYGFDVMRLHRIAANYLPTNERSGRLLKRLGFVVEGYARDYLFIDGAFRDHILTSITNHDLRDAERLCTPPEQGGA